MNLNDISPYDIHVKEGLNKIHPDIWMHLEIIPFLPEDKGKEVLRYFVKLACEPQNIRLIKIGKEAITEMPREWVINNIEEIVKETINLEDGWEFRRLLELYSQLDSQLVRRLVKVGLSSANPDVVEALLDFSDN